MHPSRRPTRGARGPRGADAGGSILRVPRDGAARGEAARDGSHPDGADGVDARLAPLAASLAARLGPVCRHWEPAAFDALVARIARTQLRWADRDGRA